MYLYTIRCILYKLKCLLVSYEKRVFNIPLDGEIFFEMTKNLLSLNGELLPEPNVLLVEVADLLHGEDGEQAGEQHQDDAAVERRYNYVFYKSFPCVVKYIRGAFK